MIVLNVGTKPAIVYQKKNNSFVSDLGDMYKNRSAVALLNGDTLWHMHKPLPDACTLQLLHYNIPQPAAVNKSFWRTCSFLLGAVINSAFKDNVDVQLHSFPSANGKYLYAYKL